MEKSVPHCKLTVIKAMVRAGKVRTTRSALKSGIALGIRFDAMVDVILALHQLDFCKSMTTYADHHIWQDVYRPMTKFGRIYLKLTVVDDVLIVSFKRA